MPAIGGQPLFACLPLCDTLFALGMIAVIYLAARAMTPAADQAPEPAADPPAKPVAPVLPPTAYQPGDRVRITAGPFRGLEGVVERVDAGGSVVGVCVPVYGRLAQVPESPARLERIA